MSKKHKYQVIIPSDINPLPETHEVSAAQIISNFLRSDAEFIIRSNYRSPDVKISGVFWEIKSPTGTGKRNIERQLQIAIKQSDNIVFDARRSKIHIAKIRNKLIYQANLTKRLERLLLITKLGDVEVIK
jgi:hypothetical protein